MEHEVLTTDGCKLQVAWSAGRVVDAEGQPDFLFAVGIDITQRKRAEQALRESQKLLQSMFNAIPDLVVVFDQDLRVVMSNWKTHDGAYLSKPVTREKLLDVLAIKSLQNR